MLSGIEYQKVVYVSADICCPGTEIALTAGGLAVIEPIELGLSPALCNDIENWQKWFDRVFDATTIPEERYAALGNRFDEEGQRLADRVQEELGADWTVEYEPQGGWRL